MIAIGGATRGDGSERALSADCGAAAVTVIGGGGSERDGSVAFGAAVTLIGGATRGGSERGAAAIGVADAGGREVTRDGTSERAGVTYDVAGWTMVATDGS